MQRAVAGPRPSPVRGWHHGTQHCVQAVPAKQVVVAPLEVATPPKTLGDPSLPHLDAWGQSASGVGEPATAHLNYTTHAAADVAQAVTARHRVRRRGPTFADHADSPSQLNAAVSCAAPHTLAENHHIILVPPGVSPDALAASVPKPNDGSGGQPSGTEHTDAGVQGSIHAVVGTHPGAVMRAIKACTNAQQLAAAVASRSHCPVYSAVHASAALTHLAQLAAHTPSPPSTGRPRAPPGGAGAWACARPLALQLAQDVADRCGGLQARQLSNVVWALSRLMATAWLLPRGHPLLPADNPAATRAGNPASQPLGWWLAQSAGQQWDAFTPQELASCLYGLAQLGYPAPSQQWLTGALHAAAHALPSMTPQGVANVVWAVSHWLRKGLGTLGGDSDDVDPGCSGNAAVGPDAGGTQGQGDSTRDMREQWVAVGGGESGAWRVRVSSTESAGLGSRRPEDGAALISAAHMLFTALWATSGSALAAGVPPSPTAPPHVPGQSLHHQHAPQPPRHSRSASHTHGTWPPASLAIVAWSVAHIGVLPPDTWRAALYRASFPVLPSLSPRDTANLAWAVARWAQATAVQVAGDRGHAAHFLPAAWHARLSGRVSELIMHLLAERRHGTEGRGRPSRPPLVQDDARQMVGVHHGPVDDSTASHAPALLTPAVAQPAVEGHAEAQAPASPAPSPVGRRAAQHGEDAVALPSLLWAAGTLRLAVPERVRHAMVGEMIAFNPSAFTVRDLLDALSLELACAAVVHDEQMRLFSTAGRPLGRRQARGSAPAAGGAAAKHDTPPSTPPPRSSRIALDFPGTASGQSGFVSEAVWASEGDADEPPALQEPQDLPPSPPQLTVRPSVYQLAWAAGWHLLHGRQDTDPREAAQSRVRLWLLVCQLPDAHLPVYRRAWRAVRAGGLLPAQVAHAEGDGGRGRADVYSPLQAAALLGALASTGFRAPVHDVRTLVTIGLRPLLSPGHSLGAEDLLQHASSLAWSTARLARGSLGHRAALGCKPKAAATWRAVLSCSLSAVEHAGTPSNTQRAMADAIAILLWATHDLTAQAGPGPAARARGPSPSPLQLQQGAQALEPTAEGPRMHHQVPLVLVRTAQQVGAHASLGGPCVQSPDSLARWLHVLPGWVRHMTGQPLLLLLSWLARLPRWAWADPTVCRGVLGVLASFVDRLPELVHVLNCAELSRLAARTAVLLHRARMVLAASDGGDMPFGEVLGKLPELVVCLEMAGEMRSAHMDRGDAARLTAAVEKLRDMT